MGWDKTSIHKVVESQRAFFRSGRTLSVEWRKRQLRRLNAAMKKYESEIMDALHKDLGRNSTEAYFCDIGTVITETNEMIAGLSRWAKPELHFSGFACFPSMLTRVYKMPYGVSLIISPFNFPILLSLGVLAASIAGGNTAVIKTSSKSEACTAILKKIIEDTDCDGIMIGRAARGNPWIFGRVLAGLNGTEMPDLPGVQDRKNMLLRELEGRLKYLPEDVAVREFRSVMPYYVKGLPGSAQIKVKLVNAVSFDEVKEIIELA